VHTVQVGLQQDTAPSLEKLARVAGSSLERLSPESVRIARAPPPRRLADELRLGELRHELLHNGRGALPRLDEATRDGWNARARQLGQIVFIGIPAYDCSWI